MLLNRVLSSCKNIRTSLTTAAWNYSTKKGIMDNTGPFTITSADSSFEKKKMENHANIAEKLTKTVPKTVPLNQYNHLENKQLSEVSTCDFFLMIVV